MNASMLSMTPDALAAASSSPLPSDTVTALEFGRSDRDHGETDDVEPGDIGHPGNAHNREEAPHRLERLLWGETSRCVPGPVPRSARFTSSGIRTYACSCDQSRLRFASLISTLKQAGTSPPSRRGASSRVPEAAGDTSPPSRRGASAENPKQPPITPPSDGSPRRASEAAAA